MIFISRLNPIQLFAKYVPNLSCIVIGFRVLWTVLKTEGGYQKSKRVFNQNCECLFDEKAEFLLKGGMDRSQPSEQRFWQDVDHPWADPLCAHRLWSPGEPLSKASGDQAAGGQDWPAVSRPGSACPLHSSSLPDDRSRLCSVGRQPQQEGEDLYGICLASKGRCPGGHLEKRRKCERLLIQAAIGPVFLDNARKFNKPEWEPMGREILTLAVRPKYHYFSHHFSKGLKIVGVMVNGNGKTNYVFFPHSKLWAPMHLTSPVYTVYTKFPTDASGTNWWPKV